jgi:hypothetical protein
MGVLAIKTISGVVLKFEFECGTFDLAQENGGLDGWVEISRDCDRWPATRTTLTPYASGNKAQSKFLYDFSERVGHRKYFPHSGDDIIETLDMSDVNGGKLPSTPCVWMTIMQNMVRKIPCEAYTIDYTTSIITIAEEWRVPGASYEVTFFAPVAT